MEISIHALREEGDSGSLGRIPHETISIHALREEGDLFAMFMIARSDYFYPRPPRGGRPQQLS